MKSILSVVAAALLGGVLLFVVGAFLGGNFATRFELFGLRGYEATGMLGLLLGVVGGAALALRRSRPRQA